MVAALSVPDPRERPVDKAAHAEGLNFALDNLIFREGIGWESSLSYNSGWVTHIAAIASLLEPLGETADLAEVFLLIGKALAKMLMMIIPTIVMTTKN